MLTGSARSLRLWKAARRRCSAAMRRRRSLSFCCDASRRGLADWRRPEPNEEKARLRTDADHQLATNRRVRRVLPNAIVVDYERDLLASHLDGHSVHSVGVRLNGPDPRELQKRIASPIDIPAELDPSIR